MKVKTRKEETNRILVLFSFYRSFRTDGLVTNGDGDGTRFIGIRMVLFGHLITSDSSLQKKGDESCVGHNLATVRLKP